MLRPDAGAMSGDARVGHLLPSDQSSFIAGLVSDVGTCQQSLRLRQDYVLFQNVASGRLSPVALPRSAPSRELASSLARTAPHGCEMPPLRGTKRHHQQPAVDINARNPLVTRRPA
jgi:hypothetical protein